MSVKFKLYLSVTKQLSSWLWELKDTGRMAFSSMIIRRMKFRNFLILLVKTACHHVLAYLYLMWSRIIKGTISWNFPSVFSFLVLPYCLGNLTFLFLNDSCLKLQSFQVEEIKQDYDTGKDNVTMVTFKVDFDRAHSLEEALKANCSRDIVFYKRWMVLLVSAFSVLGGCSLWKHEDFQKLYLPQKCIFRISNKTCQTSKTWPSIEQVC